MRTEGINIHRRLVCLRPGSGPRRRPPPPSIPSATSADNLIKTPSFMLLPSFRRAFPIRRLFFPSFRMIEQHAKDSNRFRPPACCSSGGLTCSLSSLHHRVICVNSSTCLPYIMLVRMTKVKFRGRQLPGIKTSFPRQCSRRRRPVHNSIPGAAVRG